MQPLAAPVNPVASSLVPTELANYVTPLVTLTLIQWLNNFGRKVIIVNRGLDTSEITNLILPMLQRPWFLITELVAPMGIPQNMYSNNLNFNPTLIPISTTIVIDGNIVDYIKLKQFAGEIIFVLGFGVTLDVVSAILRDLQPQFLLRAIYPATQQLVVEVDEAIMSDYQKAEYRLARSKEIEAEKAGKNLTTSVGINSPTKMIQSPSRRAQMEAHQLIHSLERGNFVYPPYMQGQYNIASDERPTMVPDLLQSQGGWINEIILRDLEQYRPKVLRLLNRLMQATRINIQAGGNNNVFVGKFVVLTQFINHHGLMLLATIFRYYGIPVFEAHGQLAKTKAKNTVLIQQQINDFNNSTGGVIIISKKLKPEFILKGVDQLIFFEGTDVNVVYNYINITYLYINYTKPHVLQLVFMISRLSETQGSSDTDFYKSFERDRTKSTKSLAYDC